MQFKISKWKKLKLIAGLMCFKNAQPISHYWWALFSASRMKALLILKDLQPNSPDKVTYLATHKKIGLWPWTQLPASPCIVLFRWKSFLDHVDHAAPRAPGRWTTARPRKATTRRQGRLGSCFPHGGEYDCTRVYWFIRRRRRITACVGE